MQKRIKLQNEIKKLRAAKNTKIKGKTMAHPVHLVDYLSICDFQHHGRPESYQRPVQSICVGQNVQEAVRLLCFKEEQIPWKRTHS